MAKKFLYFQPEYVGKFKCDGSKCNVHCCKNWRIDIDKATYEKYSRIKPESKAEEIISHMKFDSERKIYVITLDEKNHCPFLTEDNLCRFQLEYGEKFLSETCAIYPRRTNSFGNFFERSLTLTCPVAAEMILSGQEPIKFEWVKVSKKVHDMGGKLNIPSFRFDKSVAEQMLDVQVAIISILQERTLSIDQRLIVMGFFVDRLEEIYQSGGDVKKLIAVYKSKKFLAEQVPLMLQSVEFNPEKFIRLMMELFEAFYNVKEVRLEQTDRRFMDALINTLQIKPDESNQISISTIAENYEKLAEARKKFFADYSTFLENFLINEFFMGLYPYKYHRRPSRSISVFLMMYKIFELLIFSATQNNFSDKKDLLMLANWYTNQIDHGDRLNEKMFKYLEENDDFFLLMETLLEQ
ncbi:MAG: flagellin lysine-N-methylase [Selenomonadaceae bacterium]|nr:flagellin lysine-N-methylase [Selenomonadaceae bacterium]